MQIFAAAFERQMVLPNGTAVKQQSEQRTGIALRMSLRMRKNLGFCILFGDSGHFDRAAKERIDKLGESPEPHPGAQRIKIGHSNESIFFRFIAIPIGQFQ
jgi:hypothetical protein